LTGAFATAVYGDFVYSANACFVNAVGSTASNSCGGRTGRSKLGSTLTTGIHFSRSAGTPEVDGVWTSDFKWISTEPTMLTPRRPVESLQAILEALVFHCSKPCLGFGESPSFSAVCGLCLSKTAFVDVQVEFLYSRHCCSQGPPFNLYRLFGALRAINEVFGVQSFA
jgi:hypothetical protein